MVVVPEPKPRSKSNVTTAAPSAANSRASSVGPTKGKKRAAEAPAANGSSKLSRTASQASTSSTRRRGGGGVDGDGWQSVPTELLRRSARQPGAREGSSDLSDPDDSDATSTATVRGYSRKTFYSLPAPVYEDIPDLPADFVEWEVVRLRSVDICLTRQICVDLDSWEAWLTPFESTSHKGERNMYKFFNKEVLPLIREDMEVRRSSSDAADVAGPRRALDRRGEGGDQGCAARRARSRHRRRRAGVRASSALDASRRSGRLVL